MIMIIYKRALAVLMKKPFRLWGISLLSGFLSIVLTGLCGAAIPALGLAVSLLLSTSMLMVYLHGYRGEEVKAVQLFDCFKDWNTIKRVVLGLAWTNLWIFLWALIPIAGPVFAIIRSYEYRLTPYILITEPDVPLTEAMKVSAKRTNGYKLKMWGAEVLFGLMCFGAFLVLGLLSMIPYLGVLFGLIAFILAVAVAMLSGLFLGLVKAAFYEEISNPTIPLHPVAPQIPVQPGAVNGDFGPARFCSNCGAAYPSDDSAFCPNCGRPRT